MLDFLTRRRLIVCAIAILFVTLSIVFIAHLRSSVVPFSVPSIQRFSSSSNNSIDTQQQQKSECYLTEPIDSISLCHKCTSYERRSYSAGCSPTGYKELVLCSKSNIKTARPCPVPVRIQTQHFWLFEGLMLVIGLAALITVHTRQKMLDKQMVEKIKRQIGDSEE